MPEADPCWNAWWKRIGWVSAFIFVMVVWPFLVAHVLHVEVMAPAPNTPMRNPLDVCYDACRTHCNAKYG